MKRQRIVVAALTLLMLALAAGALHVILANIHPLTPERIAAPDIDR